MAEGGGRNFSRLIDFLDEPDVSEDIQASRREKPTEKGENDIEQLRTQLSEQNKIIQNLMQGVCDLSFKVSELVTEIRPKDSVPNPDEGKGNNSVHEKLPMSDSQGSHCRKLSEVEILTEVLKRNNSLKLAPEPEVFTLHSGKSLARFFGKFEQFCLSKFNMETYEQWTSELRKYLKDDLLEMFNANGGSDLEYSCMKDVLLQYAKESEDLLESRKYNLFLNAKHSPGEKLYIFALRLEKLFSAVYPDSNTDHNIELRNRFLQAIPSSLSKEIEKECYLVKIVNPEAEITWSSLKNLLRAKNNMHELSERTGTTSPSIWFNSSRNNVPMFNPNIPPPNYVSSHPCQCSSMMKAPTYVSSSSGLLCNNLSHAGGLSVGPGNYHLRNVDQKICSWCGKVGHHYDFCRRRLNLCLRCGNPNHKVIDCHQGYSRNEQLN